MKLSGGILFALLTEAKAPRTKANDSYYKESDGLSDYDIFNKLKYIFLAKESKNHMNSMKKIISQYKKCEINNSKYIPFNDKTLIDIFNKALEEEPEFIYSRTYQFIDKCLNSNKLNWLICALVDLITHDDEISTTTQINIDKNTPIPINALNEQESIEICVFLTHIFQLILNNRQINTIGKETFQELFEQEEAHCPWYYVGNLGENLSIKAKINNYIIEKANITNPTNENVSDQTIEEEIINILSKKCKKFCMKYETNLD